MLFWPVWSALVFAGNTALPLPATPNPTLKAPPAVSIPLTTYTAALKHACAQAPDIRIARAEYRLAQALESERVLSLLPEVALNFQSYYTKEFDRGEQTFVEQITNPRQPRYKNNAALSVNYWLWRSEVNPNDLDHARLNTKTAAAALSRAKKDQALQLLDSWTQVVSNQTEARIQYEIIAEMASKNAQLARLYEAKLINANDWLSARIQLEQRRETWQMALRSLGINRAELGFLLGQPLPDAWVLDPIQLPAALLAQIPEKLAEAQIPELAELNIQLAKNTLEKNQTLGRFLPQIRLTAEYTLYGADPVTFNAALSNLKRNTAIAGVVLTWSLSDLLAMSRNCSRIDREREVIEARKARAVQEANRILTGAQASYNAHQITVPALTLARQTAQTRTQNTAKLDAEQLITGTARHDDKITQLETMLAAERAALQFTRDQLAAWLMAEPDTALTLLLGPDKDAQDTPNPDPMPYERTDP